MEKSSADKGSNPFTSTIRIKRSQKASNHCFVEVWDSIDVKKNQTNVTSFVTNIEIFINKNGGSSLLLICKVLMRYKLNRYIKLQIVYMKPIESNVYRSKSKSVE